MSAEKILKISEKIANDYQEEVSESERVTRKLGDFLLEALQSKNYELPIWASRDLGDCLSHDFSEWERITSIDEEIVPWYYEESIVCLSLRGVTKSGEEARFQLHECSFLSLIGA